MYQYHPSSINEQDHAPKSTDPDAAGADAATSVGAAAAALAVAVAAAVTVTVLVLATHTLAAALVATTAAFVVAATAAEVAEAVAVSKAAKSVLIPRAPLNESAVAPVLPRASAVFCAARQVVTVVSVCFNPHLFTNVSQICPNEDQFGMSDRRREKTYELEDNVGVQGTAVGKVGLVVGQEGKLSSLAPIQTRSKLD